MPGVLHYVVIGFRANLANEIFISIPTTSTENTMLSSIFLSFFLLFQIPGATPPRPRETPKPSETPKAAETPQPQKDEPPVVTQHSIQVGGRKLDYTVTTGFMPIKNAVSGDTEARIFYMAYTMDNAAGKAPVDVLVQRRAGFGVGLAASRRSRAAAYQDAGRRNDAAAAV